MHVAQHGEAYWLIDAIASWQHSDLAKHDPMLLQFWKLIVNEDNSAQLICERDRGDIAFQKEIVFTDFPIPEIRFYFTGGVLMLPAEY
jgi:hypothetical protein